MPQEDIESVESIKKYATSHQDPFVISLTKNITKIATGEMLENFKIELFTKLGKTRRNVGQTLCRKTADRAFKMFI